MRLLIVLLWFGFIASASLWVPAYDGDIDRGDMTFVPLYAVVAALAAIGVRGMARSTREALMYTLPTIGLLGGAAVLGLVLNEFGEDFRGAPIYLYYGVAVWVSWAVLVLSTALLRRTRWDGLAGLCAGSLVAVFGLFLFIVQVD